MLIASACAMLPLCSKLPLARAACQSASDEAKDADRGAQRGHEVRKLIFAWTAGNPLKSPEPDEGIQENPSPFLGLASFHFGLAWSDLAGVHRRRRRSCRARRASLSEGVRALTCDNLDVPPVRLRAAQADEGRCASSASSRRSRTPCPGARSSGWPSPRHSAA